VRPLRPTDAEEYVPYPVQDVCDTCREPVESFHFSGTDNAQTLRWRHVGGSDMAHFATVRGFNNPSLDIWYRKSLRSKS
jgi:hypothetical protein